MKRITGGDPFALIVPLTSLYKWGSHCVMGTLVYDFVHNIWTDIAIRILLYHFVLFQNWSKWLWVDIATGFWKGNLFKRNYLQKGKYYIHVTL